MKKTAASDVVEGRRPTATLTEVLAVDTRLLFERVFPSIDLTDAEGAALAVSSVTSRMTSAGAILHRALGQSCLTTLRAHPADTVRGWAPFVVGQATTLSLAQRLELVRFSADDPHFGVREWAWLGIRAHIAANVREAIALLTPWTQSTSPRVRRFATEATRPRGVWTKKIDLLLDTPDLGLPLLDRLCDDDERYVQDSVANWVNDVAKSRPAWARDLCAQWLREFPSPHTKRICQRALRSIASERER